MHLELPRRVGFAVVLLIGLLTGCDSGAPEPARNPQDALYVCNQNSATVSIVDTDSNAVVRTVDLTEKGFSKTAKPHHVVVEPDGSAWYVSLIGADAVVKFNARNEVVGRVSFPAPGMLSLHGPTDRLYAGHTMSIPDVPGTVAVIRPSDMTRAAVLSVPFERPHGMAVSPDGRHAYSSSLATNDLAAIDAERTQVETPVSFPAASRQRYVQFDLSADGKRAYVTGQVAGQVQVLSLADPTAPTLVDSVDVGAAPWHPQLSADGSTLYVGSKATNTVYAVDTDTYETTTIEGRGLAQPHGSALAPDGQTLYVSNNNTNGRYTPTSGANVGTVVAIDTQTNAIQAVIEVGADPAGINTRWRP
jgi:DNA-binding beta-propeller fold protein YncE